MTDLDPKDLLAAIERAYAVTWQAERLEATQASSFAEASAHTGDYTAESRHPFHRLGTDRRFFLIAANDLIRALNKISYGSLVPADIAEFVRIVRNCNEHWDESSGRSGRRFTELGGTDPSSHRWGAGGTVLGDLVEVEKLTQLARRIYDDLVELERRS